VKRQWRVLGREIQLFVQDTTGDPQLACARRRRWWSATVRLLFGMVLSSELWPWCRTGRVERDLYVVGQWRWQADRLVFRAQLLSRQHLGADGNARHLAVAATGEVYQFYALGMDYAWGHNKRRRVQDEIARQEGLRRRCVLADCTKDFSTYITKIRQSVLKLLLVLQGDDNAAFLGRPRVPAVGQVQLSRRSLI